MRSPTARRALRALIILPLCTLLWSVTALAGPSKAGIQGRVFDSSGGAVAGAGVEATNLATGLRRKTVTGKGGYYALPGLPVTGQYILKVSTPGFATREVAQFNLRAGVTASVGITLSPAIQRSQVTVLGTTEGVRSDDGPEFVARELRNCLESLGTGTLYVQPGSPWEKGYCEGFNGKLRDECLNGELFYSLKEAQIVIEQWRVGTTRAGPTRHSAIGRRYRRLIALRWQRVQSHSPEL